MGKPNGTRRDRAFSEATILACLPGTNADIARRSGFSAQTVGRVLARLLKDHRAYQSAWKRAYRYWPVYSAGPEPAEFVLPKKPDSEHLAKARRNRYKRTKRSSDPQWREKENARQKKRKERNQQDAAWVEREKKRKRESYLKSKTSKPVVKTEWANGNPFSHLLSDER